MENRSTITADQFTSSLIAVLQYTGSSLNVAVQQAEEALMLRYPGGGDALAHDWAAFMKLVQQVNSVVPKGG